jgi:hypothetical protein
MNSWNKTTHTHISIYWNDIHVLLLSVFILKDISMLIIKLYLEKIWERCNDLDNFIHSSSHYLLSIVWLS